MALPRSRLGALASGAVDVKDPQMRLHGFSSRDDVCRALQALRQAWSDTARPGGQ